MIRKVAVPLFAFLLSMPLFAQHAVDRGNLYERLLCVVPMVGSGTYADPGRPMYAPLPSDMGKDRRGIIAYQFQVSDDGKFALVEFVAAERSAFATVLSAQQPQMQVFEREKSTRQQVETEFKKYKRDFSFDHFQPVRVQ